MIRVNTLPGLATRTRAPEDYLECQDTTGPVKELIKLTILNPTSGTLKLPERITITPRQKSRFIKTIGESDSKANLVLGPSSVNHIPAMNKSGKQVKINRLKAVEIETQAIKRAESTFASWIKSKEL